MATTTTATVAEKPKHVTLGKIPQGSTVKETRGSTKLEEIKPIEGSGQSVANCEKPVRIAVFFDGVNNNMFDDEEVKGISNIASLYKLHAGTPVDTDEDLQKKDSRSSYKIYVQGVGSEFPMDAFLSESMEPTWGVYQLMGAIFALGGENRLLYAFYKLLMIFHMEQHEKAPSHLTNEGILENADLALHDLVKTPGFTRKFFLQVILPFLDDKHFDKVKEKLKVTNSDWANEQIEKEVNKRIQERKKVTDPKSFFAWLPGVIEGMWSEEAYINKIAALFELPKPPKPLTAVERPEGGEFASIECVVIDVFGFSRGAAAARSFCNVMSILKTKKGMEPIMKKIKINFVGLFDTVASVGISGEDIKVNTFRAFVDDRSFSLFGDLEVPLIEDLNVPIINEIIRPFFGYRDITRNIREVSAGEDTDERINLARLPNDHYSMLGTAQDIESENLPAYHGHYSWASPKFLAIPSMVRKCVHLVALHEVRRHFGLTSVMYDNAMPANCEEIAYVGSHSDIGGGHIPGDVHIEIKKDIYKPGAKGKYSNAMLSNVPGMYMFERAIAAGVDFKKAYEITPELNDLMVIDKKLLRTPYQSYLDDNPQGSEVRDSHATTPAAYESYFEKHAYHMAKYFNMRLFLMARPEFKHNLFKGDDQLYLLTTQRQLAYYYSVFQNLEHSNYLKSHFYANHSTSDKWLIQNPVVHLQTYYSKPLQFKYPNPKKLLNDKLKKKFGDARYLFSFNLSTGFSAASMISKIFVSEKSETYMKGKYDNVFLQEAAKKPISYYLHIDKDKDTLLPDDLFLLKYVHDSVAWMSRLSTGGVKPIKGFIDTVTSDFMRFRTVYMLGSGGIVSSDQNAGLKQLYLKNFQLSDQDKNFLVDYMRETKKDREQDNILYFNYYINGRQELHESVLRELGMNITDLPMKLKGKF